MTIPTQTKALNDPAVVAEIKAALNLHIDSSGNIGVNITPSAWSGAVNSTLEGKNGGSISFGYDDSPVVYIGSNLYFDNGWKYKVPGTASIFEVEGVSGSHIWRSAPTGPAGGAVTLTEQMRIDAAGNLIVGAIPLRPNVTGLQIGDTVGVTHADSTWFQSTNAASTCMRFGKMTTERSISTAGTINTSGADYAEYENNNGLTVPKGEIVGFKTDGTLTLTFNEALRFGIKSTDPSYVGGDTWGSIDQVGQRPEPPVRAMGADGDNETTWLAKEALYAADKLSFEGRMEAARLLVDRVAYSGKVPVNVAGASPGDYILVIAAADGSITGIPVADPDFSQYKKCVGRVNRILADGRAEVAVIIH